MKVEQFVMAYKAEQDRIRALLPKEFESLRPVLRINCEIRNEDTYYIEFNTPVAGYGKQGWLNIANWDTSNIPIVCRKEGKATTFETDFLRISYIGVGVEGGCPAERNNDGCFYGTEADSLVLPEKIEANKEFCDGEFSWKFAEGDAHGESYGGTTLPAIPETCSKRYPAAEFNAQNAAHIKCEQMLGQYKVVFER